MAVRQAWCQIPIVPELCACPLKEWPPPVVSQLRSTTTLKISWSLDGQHCIVYWRTVNLFTNSALRFPVRTDLGPVNQKKNSLVEIVFEGNVLSDQYCLSVFLYHVEIVRRIHASLKQYSSKSGKRNKSLCSLMYATQSHERVYGVFEEFCDKVSWTLEGYRLSRRCLFRSWCHSVGLWVVGS